MAILRPHLITIYSFCGRGFRCSHKCFRITKSFEMELGNEGDLQLGIISRRKSFCLCISLPAGSPVNTSFQMQSAKRLPFFRAHV